jgi:hypothetical protein
MAKKISRPKHTPPSRAKEESGKRSNKKFDNTNRGVLFQNDKDGNEARPDMTGNCEIRVPKGLGEGDVFKLRIAAWEKEPKNGGDPFLSINFQEPKEGGSKE